MALTKSQLINNQIITPYRDLQATELEATEILPIVKDGGLGKYVFLYDYEVTIYTVGAKIASQGFPMGGAGATLPKNSTYTLKYSKGDVVEVVSFGMSNNDKGVLVENKNLLVIKVPKYVTPIGGFLGFPATITIDNSTSYFNRISLKQLKKVADTTPLTTKLGVGFGKNKRPDMVTVVVKNPVTETPILTPTPTDTPVLVNGVEDTTETKSFFDDKNNLLIIAGVLLIGYLLLNDKSE